MSRSAHPHMQSGIFHSGIHIEVTQNKDSFVVAFSNIADSENQERLYNQFFGYASSINRGCAPEEITGIITVEKSGTAAIAVTCRSKPTIEYFLQALLDGEVISPKCANAAITTLAAASEKRTSSPVSPHTNGAKK